MSLTDVTPGNPTSNHFQAAAFWCAFGAAATSVVSIAASQSLLGLAILALLLARARPALPRFAWPLGLFILGTLLSLAFSPDPAAGLPQVRKFYVLLAIVVVASTFRELRHSRWLVVAWTVFGTASALRGLWQFRARWIAAHDAGLDFYNAYVADRITGFMSHWMTFSGEMMIVFLTGSALLLHGGLPRRRRALLGVALAVVAVALILGMTRGIWIATFAGALYLLWTWRRIAVLALPLVLVLTVALGPDSVRVRFTSLLEPRGTTDSNMHRIVTWRTGMEMIKAHPLLGVGPERVGKVFDEYVPADIPRPLPEGYYAHLHNIYLHYAAERGIPTMLAMIAVFVLALRRWVAALRAAAPPARWLLHGGIAGVIGILVTGIFEHNLGDSEILMLTMALLAAVDNGVDATDTA